MAKQNILLESGTNEVELLEFYLGTQSFGINVLKIKHILRFEENELIVPPVSDKAVLGALDIHNKVVPIVDLKVFYDFESMSRFTKHTHQPEASDIAMPRAAIITEFNNAQHGFVVDGVNRIHRISWNTLQSINESFEMEYIIGEVIINDRVILILDLEKVVATLFGQKKVEDILFETPAVNVVDHRKDMKIVCADDSSIVRNMLRALLDLHNYKNTVIFNNGLDAYEFVMRTNGSTDPATKKVDIVVTDIEMPQMDGLTVCKRLKSQFSDIPVVVLSSLISEQTLRRCESVGADAAISKNEIEKLIPMVDKLIMGAVKNSI